MAWTAMRGPLKKLCSTILQPSARCSRHMAAIPLRTFCLSGKMSMPNKGSPSLRFCLHRPAMQAFAPARNGVYKHFSKQSGTGELFMKDHVIFQRGPVVILAREFSMSSRRFGEGGKEKVSNSNITGLIYIMAVFVLMIGGSYAAVPLYKVFCQVSGLGGQAQKGIDIEKVETMSKVEDRFIRVRFNADVASSMRWNFRPQQTEVVVAPGETALAFYTAKNPTDKPIIGISTYNILPYDAGQYFNKIQCFCFEEQRLNPNEQVDMPVFFYIDPEFAEDPKLENVNAITLSYTFFEAREGLQLPLPGYPQPHDPPMPA